MCGGSCFRLGVERRPALGKEAVLGAGVEIHLDVAIALGCGDDRVDLRFWDVLIIEAVMELQWSCDRP